MKVVFDSKLRIAGIGLVPWTRLGPEQWFPEYAIASLYGWDLQRAQNLPSVLALSDQGAVPALPRLNTHALLRTAEFQRLLETELAGHDFLTYKPVSVPEELVHRKFLMTNEAFTDEYENKVLFRQKFSSSCTFPSFVIQERDELAASPEYFSTLMGGRSKIVIQDEQLSGGKGTFLIDSYEKYLFALESLQKLSQHKRVVISEAVEAARERSIQCCVTKDGVFTGPLQEQIVRHPLLANDAIAEGDKFCGAQIVADDQQTTTHIEAVAIAKRIGEALQRDGYRGIFGIDYLLDVADRLFVLEMNPRITGVTPLLTALYRGEEGVPFYLLHLLELGDYEYSIEDASATFDKSGALLVMHSLDPSSVIIEKMPQSGTYKLEGGQPALVSRDIHLHDMQENEFILQEYMPPNMHIKPGGRLITLQFRRPVIDNMTNKLYNDVSATITAVREQIVTRAVE